jgi:ribosomal-protein-alanine N-acetyltransferase
MEIRKCDERDLDQVIEIERKSFDYPYPPYFFKWRMGDDFFIVAEENGKIVGYAMGKKEMGKGIIESIAVLPSLRRKGIGGELIKELIEQLSTSAVELQVRIGNEEAIKFYRSCGFVEREIIKNYYENGEDAILMEKII